MAFYPFAHKEVSGRNKDNIPKAHICQVYIEYLHSSIRAAYYELIVSGPKETSCSLRVFEVQTTQRPTTRNVNEEDDAFSSSTGENHSVRRECKRSNPAGVKGSELSDSSIREGCCVWGHLKMANRRTTRQAFLYYCGRKSPKLERSISTKQRTQPTQRARVDPKIFVQLKGSGVDEMCLVTQFNLSPRSPPLLRVFFSTASSLKHPGSTPHGSQSPSPPLVLESTLTDGSMHWARCKPTPPVLSDGS